MIAGVFTVYVANTLYLVFSMGRDSWNLLGIAQRQLQTRQTF